MSNDREIRCYSGEVRAETHDNDPARIIGYGSVSYTHLTLPTSDLV